MKLSGLILAGGKSRRFGPADKRLALLNGLPLVAHVAARLKRQVAHLAVAGGEDSAPLGFLNLPLLQDFPSPGLGPAGGLAAGLFWAREQGADALITAPADTPLLPLDLAEKLIAGAGGGPAIAQHGGRLHPACGLWPVTLAEAWGVAVASGQRRMMGLADHFKARPVAWPDTTPDPFLNINSPEDLARLKGPLATGG